MVGPWCFLDRFGPLAFRDEIPMNVPPHPHIGLQTVSWLLEGEVLHHDSLGYEALVKPGGVNVMTAGFGIAHSEETPLNNSGRLNGVQLWVALPESIRNGAPSFINVEKVPVVESSSGIVQVFAGSYGEITCPVPYYSEILGMDIQVNAGAALTVDINPGFEHAALLLGGECTLENRRLEERILYYLGGLRSSITANSEAGARLLLIGGPPFPERIMMWWNFVARNAGEITRARDDWENHRRFGEVIGQHGDRLAAPEFVRFTPPNPVS